MEDRRTRLPTEAEVAEINAKHLISTPINPADLLFVFGTREDVARRVDEAFRLWREDLFRWSIVSGGVTPGSTLSECQIIKTVDSFETPLSLWHTDPVFRTLVLGERDKIEPYKAKGFIAEWPAV